MIETVLIFVLGLFVIYLVQVFLSIVQYDERPKGWFCYKCDRLGKHEHLPDWVEK